jgi:hypothetical protein
VPRRTGSPPPKSAGSAATSEAAKGVTDEQLLARLLATMAPAAAAAAFARMGSHHAAAVLTLLAGLSNGPAAVAALLDCLSPVVAARCARTAAYLVGVPCPLRMPCHEARPCVTAMFALQVHGAGPWLHQLRSAARCHACSCAAASSPRGGSQHHSGGRGPARRSQRA